MHREYFFITIYPVKIIYQIAFATEPVKVNNN